MFQKFARSAVAASALAGFGWTAASACDDEIQSFAPAYDACAPVQAPAAVIVQRAPVVVQRAPAVVYRQRAVVQRAPRAFGVSPAYGYGSAGGAFAPGVGGGGGINGGRKVVIKNSQISGLGGEISGGRKVRIKNSRIGF